MQMDRLKYLGAFVATGDESNMSLWVVLLLLAVAGVVFVIVKRRKEANAEEAETEKPADIQPDSPAAQESSDDLENLSLEEIEARIRELEAQMGESAETPAEPESES